MTTETSRNSDYVPLARLVVQQEMIPQTVHNLAGSISASGNISTSLVKTDGFTLISAGITATQGGTVSIQRYLDDGGTQIQGAAVSATLTANTPANLDVLDGKPFSSFILTVTNSSGSVSTISSFALVVQSGTAASSTSIGSVSVSNFPSTQAVTGTFWPTTQPVSVGGNAGADGSTTITTGGTAQALFGSTVPTNGYAIYNPDLSNDLWVSDSATAVANGAGSVRIPANGGGFETPVGYKPVGVVSIVGAVTAQKITARRW